MARASLKFAAGKAKRKNRDPEGQFHIACASYLWRALPPQIVWSHFPAGGKRHPRDAAKLKAMGLKPGWADFILIMPNAQAAFIELKVPKNKLLKQRETGLSENQIAFRAAVTALGCAFVEVRSLEELEAVITRWLAAYGLTPLARLSVQPPLPLQT